MPTCIYVGYLDDLLNIDNNYFDGMVKQIYQSETAYSVC